VDSNHCPVEQVEDGRSNHKAVDVTLNQAVAARGGANKRLIAEMT